MKTKIISLTLTILFIISLTGNAVAQTTTVGVSVGDTFNYNYVIHWSSTDPAKTTPTTFIELNKTKSIQITITEISDTVIYANVTNQYWDGSTTTETGNIDISSENIKMPYGYLIVRANINPGEKIYPVGGQLTLNETVSRTYLSGVRETNHKMTETTTDNTYYEKTNVYFDKQTGVATDYYYEYRQIAGSNMTTIKETLKLNNTNIWAVPELSTSPTSTSTPESTITSTPTATTQPETNSSNTLIIIAGVAIAVVVVAALALLLRRRK